MNRRSMFYYFDSKGVHYIRSAILDAFAMGVHEMFSELTGIVFSVVFSAECDAPNAS